LRQMCEQPSTPQGSKAQTPSTLSSTPWRGSVGLPLAGGDHAGFACRSAALVVLDSVSRTSSIISRASLLSGILIPSRSIFIACLLPNDQQLRQHLADFVAAYNFGRRLKTLKGLAPHKAICKVWTKEPDRFTLNPHQQMPGLNI